MDSKKLLESLMQAERASEVLKILIENKFLPKGSYIDDEVIYTERDNGIADTEFEKHWAPLGNDPGRRVNTNVKGQGYNKHAALREKLTNQFDVDIMTAAVESGISIDELQRENPTIKECINRYVRKDVDENNSHFKVKHWSKVDKKVWAERNIIMQTSRQENYTHKESWRGMTIEFIDKGIGMTNKDICNKFMHPGNVNKEDMNFQQGKFSSGGLAVLTRVKGGMQLVTSRHIEEKEQGWNFSLNICVKGTKFNEYFYLIDAEASDKKNKDYIAFKTKESIKVFPGVIDDETHEFDGQTFTLEAGCIRKQQKEIDYGTLLKAYDYQTAEGSRKTNMFQSPNIVDSLDLWSYSPNFPYKAIWDVDSMLEQRKAKYKSEKEKGRPYNKFHIEKKSSSSIRQGLEDWFHELKGKNKDKQPFFLLHHKNIFKYSWSDGKKSMDAEIPIEYYIFDGSKKDYYNPDKPTDDPLARVPQGHRTLFLCNGQTHATFEMTKFKQKIWGDYKHLHRSMITVVDLSNISEHHLSSKLLDDSRTQFAQNKDNTTNFMKRLQDIISDDPTLKSVEKTLEQEIRNKMAKELKDDEKMKKIMEDFYKSHIMNVIQGDAVKTKDSGADDLGKQQKYATKFELFKGNEKKQFTKGIDNKQTVVLYETDAGDDYFNKHYGSYSIKFMDGDEKATLVPAYFELKNGKAALKVSNIHKQKLDWPDNTELKLFVEVKNNEVISENTTGDNEKNLIFKSEPKLILPEPYKGERVPTFFEHAREEVQWNYHTTPDNPDNRTFKNLTINFKTDAEDGFFARSEENYPGKIEIKFNSSWGNGILIKETEYAQYEDEIKIKISKNEFKKHRLYNHAGEFIEMKATLIDTATQKEFISEVAIFLGHKIDKPKQQKTGEIAEYSWERESEYPERANKLVLFQIGKQLIFNKDFPAFRKCVENQNIIDQKADCEKELEEEFGLNFWHSYRDQENKGIETSHIEDFLENSFDSIFLALNTRKTLWKKK